MAEKHSIPGSSLPELKKIIAGYASQKGPMSLGDVSKAAGVPPTNVSANAKFLVNLGVLKGGASKQGTDEGRKYARAVEHKQTEAAKKALAGLIAQDEFMSKLVTTVRIKEGMNTNDFTKHVLFVADQKGNSRNNTGARTIADMLVEAGLLQEDNGKLTVSTTPNEPEVQEDPAPEDPLPDDPPPPAQQIPLSQTKVQPSVTINVTLQIPECDDPDVYDRFFKAMKENLFPDG